MAYEWERCPRCGSAKVTTGSGWEIACALLFSGAAICFGISAFVDHQLMEHPIAFGIIILIGLLALLGFIMILKGGIISRCDTCKYAWEPTKIED